MRSSFRFAGAIAVAFLGVALSGSAHAIPVTVTFNGWEGFGVSEADALNAANNFGIPILTPDFVGPATDVLDIFSQNLKGGSIQPFPPTGPGPHTATSEWRMQNVGETDLIGDLYVLFVTVDPWETGGDVFDYPDENVGLSIDAIDGWALVQTSFMDGDDLVNLYYPALLLGSLESGEASEKFDVNYFIDQEILSLPNTFVLPQLRIGMAFTAIPEPGTFALFGVGLAALAARRRSLR